MNKTNARQPNALHPFLRWGLWASGFVILYVLSWGPVLRLHRQGLFPSFVMIAYDPLESIVLRDGPLARPLEAYIRWWLPPMNY
jgi:hypothetical protein